MYFRIFEYFLIFFIAGSALSVYLNPIISLFFGALIALSVHYILDGKDTENNFFIYVRKSKLYKKNQKKINIYTYYFKSIVAYTIYPIYYLSKRFIKYVSSTLEEYLQQSSVKGTSGKDNNTNEDFIDRFSNKLSEFLGSIFLVAQAITYVMSTIRWFMTLPEFSFWHGFRDLIWILTPVANFAYVWDWWFTFFGLIRIIIFGVD